MNQYGTGQNVPYSGQQESDLVNNPRYTGQSAGTNPLGHDGRGPAEESRYGAVPLSTGTGTNPLPGHGQPGLGGQNTSDVWPSPAAPPHAHRPDLAGRDQYGNPQREGMVDKMKDAVGVGPHSGTAGYDNRRDQPGYGTPGYDNYGQPRKEGMVDKVKDAVGTGPHSGTAGYDNRRDQPGYGTPGYDNYGQPRKEGMVDKVKDAVGTGPHSGTAGYDNRRDQPGYGTPGYDNYGQPRKEGMVDKVKDAVGTGPHSGTAGYDNRRDQPGYGTPGYDNYGQPRKEGMVDKVKDAVGMGPHSGTHPHDATHGPHTGQTQGLDYTNINHPSEERGFGGGLGHPHGTNTGYDQSHGLGSGLGTGQHPDGVHLAPGHIPVVAMGERRVEPGYDASRGHIGHNYHGTTGSPRKEGIVEKIKDAVGMGKHDNTTPAYPGSTTGTGYPHSTMGETGLGHHGNTTSTYESTPSYSHNSMVDTGLGHDRHPGSNTGYPHESTGDKVKDAVGVGHHDTTGYPRSDVTDTDYDRERRGKGFEDTTGLMHDTRTGPGYDATRTGIASDYDATRAGLGTGYDGTRTGTGTGTGYDDTNVDYPHNDANAYGVGGAPPKKGIVTKIKEKLHH